MVTAWTPEMIRQRQRVRLAQRIIETIEAAETLAYAAERARSPRTVAQCDTHLRWAMERLAEELGRKVIGSEPDDMEV